MTCIFTTRFAEIICENYTRFFVCLMVTIMERNVCFGWSCNPVRRRALTILRLDGEWFDRECQEFDHFKYSTKIGVRAGQWTIILTQFWIFSDTWFNWHVCVIRGNVNYRYRYRIVASSVHIDCCFFAPCTNILTYLLNYISIACIKITIKSVFSRQKYVLHSVLLGKIQLPYFTPLQRPFRKLPASSLLAPSARVSIVL